MRKADKHLGTVIAERRLHVRGAPQRAVVVSLGKPRKSNGTEDWECPFRIVGTGIRVVEYGRGIDAFQALTMALEGIRYYLDRSSTPLVWGDVFDDHSGFQRVIPLLPESAEIRSMERIVDRELRRRLAMRERRHKERTRRRREHRSGRSAASRVRKRP